MSGDIATTWQAKKVNLQNFGLVSKDTPKKENTNRVRGLLGKVFWTSVALINVAVLTDLFLNKGNGLINLFFALTGGY